MMDNDNKPNKYSRELSDERKQLVDYLAMFNERQLLIYLSSIATMHKVSTEYSMNLAKYIWGMTE